MPIKVTGGHEKKKVWILEIFLPMVVAFYPLSFHPWRHHLVAIPR